MPYIPKKEYRALRWELTRHLENLHDEMRSTFDHMQKAMDSIYFDVRKLEKHHEQPDPEKLHS